jgi:hypothetical protein
MVAESPASPSSSTYSSALTSPRDKLAHTAEAIAVMKEIADFETSYFSKQTSMADTHSSRHVRLVDRTSNLGHKDGGMIAPFSIGQHEARNHDITARHSPLIISNKSIPKLACFTREVHDAYQRNDTSARKASEETYDYEAVSPSGWPIQCQSTAVSPRAHAHTTAAMAHVAASPRTNMQGASNAFHSPRSYQSSSKDPAVAPLSCIPPLSPAHSFDVSHLRGDASASNASASVQRSPVSPTGKRHASETPRDLVHMDIEASSSSSQAATSPRLRPFTSHHSTTAFARTSPVAQRTPFYLSYGVYTGDGEATHRLRVQETQDRRQLRGKPLVCVCVCVCVCVYGCPNTNLIVQA